MLKWILTIVIVYVAYHFLIVRPRIKPPANDQNQSNDDFTDYEELD